MMDLEVEESIDFDFFDERPQGENANITPQVSALKPPPHPHSEKQLPKPDSVVNDNKHSDTNRGESSSSRTDSSRDGSPDLSSGSDSEGVSEPSSRHRKDAVESQNRRSRSSSASSVGSSVSSSSSTDIEQADRHDSRSNSSGVRKGTQSDSDDREKRPINPLAKPVKHATFNKGRHRENYEYSSNMFSDSDSSKLNISAAHKKNNKYYDENSGEKDTKHAWDAVKGTKGKKRTSVLTKHSKNLSTDRPKTAARRNDKHSEKSRPSRSRSDEDSSSDSDITDVSSIDETPRNEIKDSRNKQKLEERARMTSAGDGHPVKLQLKPDSYVREKDIPVNYDYDPDKITGFDLRILMKAVGELEKQNRAQTNSRRVMFAPTILKGCEKSNYTFDKNQTRDIERENHRLLKEIIRQVSSGEQKRQFCRQPGPYRLTPSAVNRERDIQRIERENLAFLRRLQDVKPTKSVCREQQLRAYENTVYHGIPVAALHHTPNGKRSRSAADNASALGGGRADSASSISSIGSSVHSIRSVRSSRPASAKSGFSVKRIDSRPAWTDRW